MDSQRPDPPTAEQLSDAPQEDQSGDSEDELTLIARTRHFSTSRISFGSIRVALTIAESYDLGRKRRLIPLAEIECVFPFSVRVSDRFTVTYDEYGLMIETLGYPLRVGPSRDLEAVECLQERIERRLQALNPGWINAPWCAGREVLDSSRTLREPPSDSRIVCRREWDHTEFIRHAPAKWAANLAIVPGDSLR